MQQQTFFEEIKNLVKHPVIDSVFAEGEQVILETCKRYKRGMFTNNEFLDKVTSYYPSARQICPFMGLSLALTAFLWGSYFYESQYMRLMEDYELYHTGRMPNSKTGTPWLIKDLNYVQPFNEVDESSQWHNTNKLVENMKMSYYHPWITTRFFSEEISAESEASIKQKIKFFQLCDILGYAPDKLWFKFIPSGLDYPQISNITHLYHDGGYVSLLFPFQCENGAFDTPIEGETYRFVAKDGTRAEMQFDMQKEYETMYRGFIEHYTREGHDTVISINRIKDTNWYNLYYFFSYIEEDGNVFKQDQKWADFRAWQKHSESDYNAYPSQRDKVLYRILKEICGQDDADWITQSLKQND